MNPTIDIPDALVDAVRTLAAAEQTTIRALVIKGLQLLFAERRLIQSFKLRKATFRGSGLQPLLAGASWDHIREMAYAGCGDNEDT